MTRRSHWLTVTVWTALTAVTTLVPATRASAHGERTQPPWVRTETAAFFDLAYSGSITHDGEDLVLPVGKSLTLTGKLALSGQWPVVLGQPKIGYVGLNMPGPVLSVRVKKVNGVLVPGSVVVKPDDFFQFEIQAVGRRPGRWHIHPRIDIAGQGPVVGPGQWIRVADSGTPYRNLVTLVSGKHVDLDSYGLGVVLGWHILWIVIGGAFSLMWLRRKNLLDRVFALRQGAVARPLISSRDRRMTAAVVGLTVVVLFAAPVFATAKGGIALQIRRERVPELTKPKPLADVTAEGASYNTQQETLLLKLKIKSFTGGPIQIERLIIGSLSFAPAGLRQPNDSALVVQPGPADGLQLILSGPQLQAEGLTNVKSALAQIGGLVFIGDGTGQQSWSFIVADLVTDIG